MITLRGWALIAETLLKVKLISLDDNREVVEFYARVRNSRPSNPDNQTRYRVVPVDEATRLIKLARARRN